MSLEPLNLSLFHVINGAQDASQFIIRLAIFFANDLLYILLFILTFFMVLWRSRFKKIGSLNLSFLTCISLLVGYIISLFYHHPRPFVMGVGTTFIEHAPTASFPSNHMLIFSTISLSYLFAQRKIIGMILLFLSFVVAWSRIYLGVHFPLDMLGAFIVALLVNTAGYYFWNAYGTSLTAFFIHLYQIICKPLLDRGLIK
ncbi:undecaprenyl-diphosphatase [Acinetobacter nosocomialis]|nr:undecaprenyl-diphosphatase [Acinetobacter nosocomialis]